jgi:hypothetical protein
MFSDTQEKQFVRANLWKPVLDAVCKRIGNSSPKYLCFPGGACLELKFLREECQMNLDNVCAVERDEIDASSI